MNDETHNETASGDPTTVSPEYVDCPNCGGPALVTGGVITSYEIDEYGVREVGRIIEHNGTMMAFVDEPNEASR